MEKIIKRKKALEILKKLNIQFVAGINGARDKEFLPDTDMLEKWLNKKLIKMKFCTYETSVCIHIDFFDNYAKYYLEKNGSSPSYHTRIITSNFKNFKEVAKDVFNYDL